MMIWNHSINVVVFLFYCYRMPLISFSKWDFYWDLKDVEIAVSGNARSLCPLCSISNRNNSNFTDIPFARLTMKCNRCWRRDATDDETPIRLHTVLYTFLVIFSFYVKNVVWNLVRYSAVPISFKVQQGFILPMKVSWLERISESRTTI